MAELRELVTLMARRLPARGPRKLAIVASRAITYVVAGEFREFVELAGVRLQVEAFADFESAWKWLRPDDPVESSVASAAAPPRRESE